MQIQRQSFTPVSLCATTRVCSGTATYTREACRLPQQGMDPAAAAGNGCGGVCGMTRERARTHTYTHTAQLAFVDSPVPLRGAHGACRARGACACRARSFGDEPFREAACTAMLSCDRHFPSCALLFAPLHSHRLSILLLALFSPLVLARPSFLSTQRCPRNAG